MEFKGTKGKIYKSELELFKNSASDYHHCSVYDEKEILISKFFGWKSEEVKSNALLFTKSREILEMLKECLIFYGRT